MLHTTESPSIGQALCKMLSWKAFLLLIYRVLKNEIDILRKMLQKF